MPYTGSVTTTSRPPSCRFRAVIPCSSAKFPAPVPGSASSLNVKSAYRASSSLRRRATGCSRRSERPWPSSSNLCVSHSPNSALWVLMSPRICRKSDGLGWSARRARMAGARTFKSGRLSCGSPQPCRGQPRTLLPLIPRTAEPPARLGSAFPRRQAPCTRAGPSHVRGEADAAGHWGPVAVKDPRIAAAQAHARGPAGSLTGRGTGRDRRSRSSGSTPLEGSTRGPGPRRSPPRQKGPGPAPVP